MAPFGRIYSYLGNPRTTSALVVARMNALDIELIYTQPREGVSAEYRRLNPLGRVPTFVGSDGYVLTETIAVNVYSSQNPYSTLLGQTKQDFASILRWMSFANSEIHPTGRQWFRPLLGIDPYDVQKVQIAKQKTRDVLAVLENHLRERQHNSTYIVGEQSTPTLADLFVAGILARQFDTILDRKFREDNIPRTTQWFQMVTSQPDFKAVHGEARLCEEAVGKEK